MATACAIAVYRIRSAITIFGVVPQPDKIYNLPRGQFAPDANTRYDLASVSKAITAGAVLLLQQDGKLSVNDPLSKYFPAFSYGNQIPLRLPFAAAQRA